MTDDEFMLAASDGVMALFLGDERKTEWEPYSPGGVLNRGPGQFFADTIRVRTEDGSERAFPFRENPGPHLIYPGVQCYVNWP